MFSDLKRITVYFLKFCLLFFIKQYIIGQLSKLKTTCTCICVHTYIHTHISFFSKFVLCSVIWIFHNLFNLLNI